MAFCFFLVHISSCSLSNMATSTQEQVIELSQATIPEKYLNGLDPEWRDTWSKYGGNLVGAHLVTIEEFRKSPERYSFTYPIWTGMIHHDTYPTACRFLMPSLLRTGSPPSQRLHSPRLQANGDNHLSRLHTLRARAIPSPSQLPRRRLDTRRSAIGSSLVSQYLQQCLHYRYRRRLPSCPRVPVPRRTL